MKPKDLAISILAVIFSTLMTLGTIAGVTYEVISATVRESSDVILNYTGYSRTELVGCPRSAHDVELDILARIEEPYEPVEEEQLIVETAAPTVYICKNTARVDKMELTDYEYDLLSRVVCLEGGGESRELQHAIAEVLYNRIISGIWGNTVEEMVYAVNQNGYFEFEVVPNIPNAQPSDLTREVVTDVFNGNVTIKPSVLYFRTDYYHPWYGAIPEFNIGNVYFSSSIWN